MAATIKQANQADLDPDSKSISKETVKPKAQKKARRAMAFL